MRQWALGEVKGHAELEGAIAVPDSRVCPSHTTGCLSEIKVVAFPPGQLASVLPDRLKAVAISGTGFYSL